MKNTTNLIPLKSFRKKKWKKSGISIYLTINPFNVLPGTLNWFCALFKSISLLRTFLIALIISSSFRVLTVLCWFQFKLSKFSTRHTVTKKKKSASKYAHHHLSQLLPAFHCFCMGSQINCASHSDILRAVRTHKLY